MKIENIALDALIPYARNSRTHSDAQVAQVAASIVEFGFTNPVLIDGQGGIIAGHGRVMAARKLEMDSVPCIRLGHLSEAQKRAYVIADNKLAANAGWDEQMLALEFKDLQDMGFDLDLTGFDDKDINAMIASLDATPEGNTDADATPAVQAEVISKLGDIWTLGKHRIMCGDSTSSVAVNALMDGKKAALIHADPPYGMGKEKDGVENDNLYADKLDAFQMAWWKVLRPHAEDNASAYIWGNAPELWRLWYQGGLSISERMTLRNEIVWKKAGGFGITSAEMRGYPPQTERCLFFVLGEQGFNTNSDNYWEGWEPVRGYLDAEMKKAGWTVRDLNRVTGTQMGSHWVTKSQWTLITAEHYKKIQQAARDHDAFKRDHDAFKRDHDALKRDFYATRAYFDNTHDNMTDVWEFGRVTGEVRHGHATPKPVDMIARCIKSTIPAGGLCVEPFSGSGTTLIAAEQTARICFAMELSPAYVDVAVRRWQQYTGNVAVNAETGEKFPG
jgi:DNA modification methylase